MGALLISLLGTKLLTKTKYPVPPKVWRRSHRPSIRDISIIAEDQNEEYNNEIKAETSVSYKQSGVQY